MATRDLIMKAILDDKQVKKGFDGIEKKGKNLGASLTKGFGGVAGKLAGIAAGAGLIVGAFSLIKKALGAFVFDAEAIAGVEAALASQGLEVEKNSKALQANAAALQEVTKFGNEYILSLQEMAILQGANAEEADIMTRAALGMAKVFNIDTNTSLGLILKSVNSGTNAWTRYGVQLDKNATKVEMLDAFIKASLPGLSALEAETLTYLGALAQLDNAWGDFLESVIRASGLTFPTLVASIKSVKGILVAFGGALIDTEGQTDESTKAMADRFKNLLISVASSVVNTIAAIRIFIKDVGIDVNNLIIGLDKTIEGFSPFTKKKLGLTDDSILTDEQRQELGRESFGLAFDKRDIRNEAKDLIDTIVSETEAAFANVGEGGFVGDILGGFGEDGTGTGTGTGKGKSERSKTLKSILEDTKNFQDTFKLINGESVGAKELKDDLIGANEIIKQMDEDILQMTLSGGTAEQIKALKEERSIWQNVVSLLEGRVNPLLEEELQLIEEQAQAEKDLNDEIEKGAKLLEDKLKARRDFKDLLDPGFFAEDTMRLVEMAAAGGITISPEFVSEMSRLENSVDGLGGNFAFIDAIEALGILLAGGSLEGFITSAQEAINQREADTAARKKEAEQKAAEAEFKRITDEAFRLGDTIGDALGKGLFEHDWSALGDTLGGIISQNIGESITKQQGGGLAGGLLGGIAGGLLDFGFSAISNLFGGGSKGPVGTIDDPIHTRDIGLEDIITRFLIATQNAQLRDAGVGLTGLEQQRLAQATAGLTV